MLFQYCSFFRETFEITCYKIFCYYHFYLLKLGNRKISNKFMQVAMYFDALLVLTKLNLVVIYLHRNDRAIRGDLQKKEKRQREREREWENARVSHGPRHVITNRLFVFPRNVTLICPNLNKFHGRCCS